MKSSKKLSDLRTLMQSLNIDACIIPTSDRHQSEYVPPVWMDREWLTGFTGSAGIAIVTQDHAALWTDGRYFIQAEEELEGSGFVLHKQVVRHEPEHLLWLNTQLNKSAMIAYNGWNFTHAQVQQMIKVFAKNECELIDQDLISAIWTDRPELPNQSIEVLSTSYAGRSRAEKINDLRSQISAEEIDASHCLITSLDEIAWLLNLRGSDVEFNPVFISYCIVGPKSTTLFVDDAKLDSATRLSLQEDNIILRPYDSITDYLSSLQKEDKIYLDQSLVSEKLYQQINAKIINGDSLVQNSKGIKNDIELAHWQNAMVKDGVALTHAFYWLEKELKVRSVSEVEFGEKLTACRSAQAGYKGDSFPPIVGFASNGAILHYRAKADTCKKISNQNILLCDSGAQYTDGTTDITRTIALSPPSPTIKHHFTLVLKGLIALTKAVFPEGTTGGQLDLLARQFLWSEGLDFMHGTGHGVGFYLNVHEGPHGFAAPYSSRGKKPLLPGMVITNEPGYYIPNEYGIRLENLLVTVKSSFDNFFKFETLTLFPFDQSLIDETKMSSSEKAWFNQYHRMVYDRLHPHLPYDLSEWLKKKCKPLN